MSRRPTWPQYAMGLAFAAASRSEDPFCKVGAAILDRDGATMSTGYNGTVPGVDIDWTDRDARRPLVIHAESNALRYVTPEWKGYDGGLMAVTHWPCGPCVLLAAAYGIRRIYWDLAPDWRRYPAAEALHIAETVGVKLEHISCA